MEEAMEWTTYKRYVLSVTEKRETSTGITEMDKESIYELQKIDCNCNDCVFMVRNIEKFNQSLEFHRGLQLDEYTRNWNKQNKLTDEFYRTNELEKGYAAERELRTMKFQFDKSKCRINYGHCQKFDKEVSFMANTIMDNQKCFKHRRENNSSFAGLS